jgi:hypothetical protein
MVALDDGPLRGSQDQAIAVKDVDRFPTALALATSSLVGLAITPPFGSPALFDFQLFAEAHAHSIV